MAEARALASSLTPMSWLRESARMPEPTMTATRAAVPVNSAVTRRGRDAGDILMVENIFRRAEPGKGVDVTPPSPLTIRP